MHALGNAARLVPIISILFAISAPYESAEVPICNSFRTCRAAADFEGKAHPDAN
jgi:hypothetical protein